MIRPIQLRAAPSLRLGAVLGVLFHVGFAAFPAFACTTFCLRDSGRVIFGKNYDWNIGDGLLIVNPRGLARTADSGDRPARWTAKYGSVTFNQYGRDFPSGGMNEAGLAIELMWLEGSRYPTPDARHTVDVLQWIQYQLDTQATVAGVLASDRKIRIASGAPIHYLVADRTGQVATVEFLNGRLVAHSGERLPVAVLTNDTYETSLRYKRDLGAQPAPGDERSLPRFARTADRVRGFATAKEGKKNPVAYAFETLDRAAQPSTRWSLVYELDRLRVHFRTRERRQIRSLSFANLDFRCSQPVRVLDLAANVAGDVAKRLVPYQRGANRRLVEIAYRSTPFLATTPRAEIDRLARVPEAATCRIAGK
jgi:penicillin V acylase-like amidase (Ntn superfamily)